MTRMIIGDDLSPHFADDGPSQQEQEGQHAAEAFLGGKAEEPYEVVTVTHFWELPEGVDIDRSSLSADVPVPVGIRATMAELTITTGEPEMQPGEAAYNLRFYGLQYVTARMDRLAEGQGWWYTARTSVAEAFADTIDAAEKKGA